MPPMSIRRYSESRRADRRTVQRKVRDGTIPTDDEGRIDSEEADRLWASARGKPANGADGERAASAKIAHAAAKLRLAKQRFDAEQARYAPRVAALERGVGEAEYFLAALAAAPGVHGDRAAALLGVDPAIARQLLERFLEITRAEVGDLRAEAIRAIEAL